MARRACFNCDYFRASQPADWQGVFGLSVMLEHCIEQEKDVTQIRGLCWLRYPPPQEVIAGGLCQGHQLADWAIEGLNEACHRQYQHRDYIRALQRLVDDRGKRGKLLARIKKLKEAANAVGR